MLAIGMVIVVACTSPAAWAQSLGQGLSAPGDGLLMVPAAGVSGARALSGSLTVAHSSHPLRIVTPSLHRDSVVSRRTVGEVALGFAYQHRWLLFANAPLILSQAGEAPPDNSSLQRPEEGVALEDTSLSLRGFLVGAPRRRVGLSAQATVWLPLGSEQAYGSDDHWRGKLVGILGGRAERHLWSLELGAQTRREQQLTGVVPYRLGHEAVIGAGAQLALDFPARVFVGSEVRAVSTVSNGAKLLDPKSSRGIWLATVAWRVRGSPLSLSAALGPGIGEGPGAGDWHAFCRVAWAPFEEPPLPDADADGVPDGPDACRSLAGVPSEDPLMHGCPDMPVDRDGDAIFDAMDACPDKAGLPSAKPQRHGCPEQALPPPEQPSPKAPPQAALEGERIVIQQQVQFETGTATLKPESADILGQVAAILREHPELARVEVQGHADEVGTPEFNRRLSVERAQAVVDWLVAHGVQAERLVARGHGSDRPLASNATEEGRAQNRRVEFHVLDRLPQDGAGGSGAP